MRMEEFSGNNFIKETDTVERHLLELVRNYFEANESATDQRTQEYIIEKAVQRMKEELDIDNAGVVSVNGEKGDIVINADTLGAEPEIPDKKTAFNKDFGNTAGTVCEGNDPRLSDARTPLPHTHSMGEINGLSGEIARVENLIDLLSGSGHSHSNRSVLDKIIYTGNSSTINLDAFETACATVDSKIIEVQSKIDTYTSELDSLIAEAHSLGL